MKALILNNRVVDTAETAFEVAEPLFWVDCLPYCATGEWELVDGVLREITSPDLTYATNRSFEYPSIPDQLDMIYHNGDGGATFQSAIKAVKDKYPKE